MTAEQLKQLAATLGFDRSEMAKLLGLSIRTLTRGVRRDGTAAALLFALQRQLADPHSLTPIRALAIQAVRADGLPHFLDRLLGVFVAAERLQLQQPNAGGR